MQIHVLGKAAKAKGQSKPPVAQLPRPQSKEQRPKGLIARYEVKV